jgi:hypothetical protein
MTFPFASFFVVVLFFLFVLIGIHAIAPIGMRAPRDLVAQSEQN